MSITTISQYKKPLHRRDNSGELDVFEAARYFSGYNENHNAVIGDEGNTFKHGKQGKLRARGGSLDMPCFKQNHQYYYKEYHENYRLARLEQHHQQQKQQPPPPQQQQQQQQQRQQILKENKKFKQPSSPGGKLAQFINSIFNQRIITSRKKKLPKTMSMRDEDENPSGRRLIRRSSISHFRSTSSVVDEKTYYSSSISGFQTPKISPYTINSASKTYQNVENFQDYNRVLATLSKYKIQEKEVATKIKGDEYSDNRGNYDENTSEFNKISEDKMDDYEDDVESDASSDLFELQIDDEFTFCSTGLPVYETTRMDI